MDTDATLRALYARRPQDIKPGLARIEAALAELDPALTATPTVLVAGTNGKGTTTGFLWQLAVAAGLRAGLFTSPHLIRFAERIRHSHVNVDDELLVAELGELERSLSPAVSEALSFFELSTLIALRLFHRVGSDMLALEVGLGGRWDSTNATDPAVSVITSIGLDHQEYLGNTPEAIAREKAGVMRAGRLVIWGGVEAGAPAADRAIREAAATCGAKLVALGEEIGLSAGKEVWLALPGLPALTVPLPRRIAAQPSFLQRNFALAVAAFYALRRDPELVRAAARVLDEDRVPPPPCLWARFQSVLAAPAGMAARPLILDVGHNPDGARALVKGLRETGALAQGPLPALVSILGDKAYDEVLDILREVLDPVLLFANGSERSWTAAGLAPRHRHLAFLPNFAAAFAALPPEIGATAGRPTVVTGSVYAVGEALEALRVSPLAPAL